MDDAEPDGRRLTPGGTARTGNDMNTLWLKIKIWTKIIAVVA